ncbi:hypothetical protein OOK27_19480 [Streptomyces canus]|uniref:hypothetical protein n=1 Tax=Streptomyces canus TaxID=58343 RepID=UPI002253C221|nr:hypothetical protein [Streptomyces canus]MCX5256286.1 hypothetical protein [Streptomyces canus]
MPGAYHQAPAPGTYEQAPAPGTYQQPPAPGTNQQPPTPRAYQQAPTPGTYQQGPTPGTNQQTPAPGPHQQPPTPGAYQQAPTPGPYQQAPAPGPYQQMPTPGRPQQYGGGMPAGGPGSAACQICGAAPAAPVTVRGHQGMLVIMRFLKREGIFCRTCALASFRDMQAETMVLGWWGPLSLLITPFTLLANLSALSGIRRIPEPVTAGFRPPLDPGKPVFKRPAGILALIPMGLLGLAVFAFTLLVIVGAVAGPSSKSSESSESSESDGLSDYPNQHYPTLTVGSCARNDRTWPYEDLKPEPCDSSAAQYRVHPWTNDTCASGDHSIGPMYSKDHDKPLCLRPLKG